MLILGRRIISPYCAVERLSKKYPSRIISPEAYTPNNEAYYQNGQGKLRMLRLDDWSVWEGIKDENGWPSGYQQKIWPRTEQTVHETSLSEKK